MEYKYLEREFNTEDVILPDSDRINKFLLKNHYADAVKAIDFLDSGEKLLYIHGFLGTGKRQFINYLSEFLNKDVIKLEYYCKQGTVCDDILLSFISLIEKNAISSAITYNNRVSTMAMKLRQYISSIKKPFVIIFHSFDDISEENKSAVIETFFDVLSLPNVKTIISTRAMLQSVFGNMKIDRKIFLKALSREIFQDYAESYKITGTEEAFNNFYKYTRGYYYYTALTIKLMLSMKLSLNDFLAKYSMSGIDFDSYIGMTYINLIPTTIRNFFWFLRCIRHGISINALAVFDLYDEFSVGYLKNNLMIFQADDVLYVQDYFQQDIDVSIPEKMEVKLHKYIITIYEKELKSSLPVREILISRQALRAEIEYHTKCIEDIESGKRKIHATIPVETTETTNEQTIQNINYESKNDIYQKMEEASKLAENKKITEAIEKYHKIMEEDFPDMNTLAEIRLALARLYKSVEDYQKAQHYYELVENYYIKNEENINLNYLYFELTQLYFAMFKIERAIETAQKVIYAVDTPRSLLVETCTLLGNIQSENKNPEEAYKYYQKALESIDGNTSKDIITELYFKFALANDDKGDDLTAFEYYTKCIQSEGNNPYKALAYSNMGSCYFENENYTDAMDCFQKAYTIEKANNNYEGIYYTSSYIAKIYGETDVQKALNYLLEAKQSAEFINEDFYIIEATIALGDYYYDKVSYMKKALIEYFKARRTARNFGDLVDLSKIEERINDMKLRMDIDEYTKTEQQYG